MQFPGKNSRSQRKIRNLNSSVLLHRMCLLRTVHYVTAVTNNPS